MDYLLNEIKMTSRELAEITGKQHQHIMRDIRNEIESLGEQIGQSIFWQSSYIKSQTLVTTKGIDFIAKLLNHE